MPRPKTAPDISFLHRPAQTPSGIFDAGMSTAGAIALEIALDRLENNPYQPVDRGDPASVAELAAVIGEQGFQGVVSARPHPDKPGYYQLAWGHQRRDAAGLAGLTTIPVQVREFSDQEMAELIVTENVQRQDLTPMQEADLYRLIQTIWSLTQEEIGLRVGKDRVYVAKRLALLGAPADVQQLLRAKPDSLRAAENLKQIGDPDQRAELIAGFQAGTITTNDIVTARQAPSPHLAGARIRPEARIADAPALASPHSPETGAPPAPVSHPAADSEEAARARSGLLKLSTAAESLTRYEQQAAERGKISLREYTKLCELQVQVERIYRRYSPQDAE